MPDGNSERAGQAHEGWTFAVTICHSCDKKSLPVARPPHRLGKMTFRLNLNQSMRFLLIIDIFVAANSNLMLIHANVFNTNMRLCTGARLSSLGHDQESGRHWGQVAPRDGGQFSPQAPSLVLGLLGKSKLQNLGVQVTVRRLVLPPLA
jgi:hypothetical protein